jgi:hypothetical protein
MLKFMPESQGNFLGFRARKQITLKDFRQTLAPRLEAAIAEAGRVRLLLCLEDDFEGFDLEAIKGEVLDSRHKDRLEKIAVVGGSWWTKLEIRLGAAQLAGEVQTFDREELEEAWEWLRGDKS